jgi:hypothetical protein
MIPDNRIDYRAFDFGKGRRDQDSRPSRHAKQSNPKVIRQRMEPVEAERHDENMQGEPRDARSRVIMLALKYEKLDDAYGAHENEIGHHLSRLTFANIFTEARRALKVFKQVGVIDQRALDRYRRDK